MSTTAEPRLDLTADVATLTTDLVDVPSESQHEVELADLVQAALAALPHLRVHRLGNTVVARTELGRLDRVVIAGHLDTVPSSGNLPAQRDGGIIHGLGACDMKGGVAVALKLAHDLPSPNRDVTYLFYDGEEIDSRFNGLRLVAEAEPEWLAADFAILMEPTNADVEAGCQGTLRARVHTVGKRAHSARAWLGSNAVHQAAEILNRLLDYEPSRVVVDGMEYREGLNAVGIEGGVAGNVIPDECVVTVNYRFAPSTTPVQAEEHVRLTFEGFPVEVVDLAAGAMPGLHLPAARDFVAAVGGSPKPKFGWTDVARFAELGIPAVNFGPGDPAVAHSADEHVSERDLTSCESAMRTWLGAG